MPRPAELTNMATVGLPIAIQAILQFRFDVLWPSKEVITGLTKPPLKFSGGLANLVLTSKWRPLPVGAVSQ